VEIRARTDEKWMLQHHPSLTHERERAQQHSLSFAHERILLQHPPFHYFFLFTHEKE